MRFSPYGWQQGRSVEDDGGPWNEYRRLVVRELEGLNLRLTSLNDKLDGKLSAMQVDLITLKVKAGLLGALGGTVFGAVVSWIVSKH